MANLNDIANLANSLEKPKISVRPDRCVRVRNRNATCTRCIDVCPASALSIENNEIQYSATDCVGCGTCVSVCPVEALIALTPTESDLVAQVATTAEAAEGTAYIACARIASKKQGDPDKYTEIPCLGRIDESFLLALCAWSSSDVVLIDGDCNTCKYGCTSAVVSAAVEDCKSICAQCETDVNLSRVTGFPEQIHIDDPEGRFGTDRRGFFTEAAQSMKETTLTAARHTLEQKLGGSVIEENLGERLRVGETGSLPQFPMPRRDRALDAIDSMNIDPQAQVGERLFGKVEINTDTCNSCGMCAMFCPTGALKATRDEAGKLLVGLEFLACDCVSCNLCVDVCWKDSLVLTNDVSAEQLFSFQPVSFNIAKQKAPGNRLFGKF